MRNALLTTLCVLIYICGFTQQFTLRELQLMSISSGVNSQTFDNQYQSINGSAFLFDNWVQGEAISGITGQHFTGLKLKVDLYKSKIFLNLHDTVYDLSDAANINRFILFPGENDTIKKMIFTYKAPVPGAASKLMQVLAEGPKISLYKNFTKNPEQAQTGLYAAKEERFMDYKHYYAVKDGAVTEVTISKKGFDKVFTGDDAEKIKAHLKSKGLSPGNEDGWAEAFTYYNSL
ncbi:MAG TPA: hypothetical protein VHB48_18705 [Chitinophagaceae bacterium]|jgi:hypothetical protein|nr:hypothetical protein [Chitinophagaceae bacterium]